MGDGIKGRINVGLVLIGIRSVLGIAYRRFNLSAKTPAKGLKIKMGI